MAAMARKEKIDKDLGEKAVQHLGEIIVHSISFEVHLHSLYFYYAIALHFDIFYFLHKTFFTIVCIYFV